MTLTRSTMVGLCLAAAAAWGLLWLPIRVLEEAGLSGGYGALALNIATLPTLFALALFAHGSVGRRAAFGSVVLGVAITAYAASLALTDVVRAVLLFYLAPAWSVAIECLFMGRRFGLRSLVALALSFAGVVTVFRAEISLAGFGAGDALAIASGMAWSVGAALVYTDEARHPARLALLCGLAAVASAALLAPATGPAPELSVALEALALWLAAGALFLAPVLAVTLWAAVSLPPATLSFLLTAEIVAGVGSAALLLYEPFGWPEALGACLIAAGAVAEVATLPRPFGRRRA